MELSNDNNVVFFAPGPLHLFWTTGYFSLCELVQTHEVVLIVTSNYRKNKKFTKLIDAFSLLDVVYHETESGIVKRSVYTSRLYRDLVLKYRPVSIIQHSFFYIEDMYLMYWKNKLLQNCEYISFQNARFSNNPADEFRAVEAAAITRFLSTTSLKSRLYAKYFLRFKNQIKYVVEFKVIPFLLLGTMFVPSVKAHTRSINSSVLSPIDAYLYYRDNELDVIKTNLGSGHYYKKVRHPVETAPKYCFELFDSLDLGSRNNIIILPSYGDIDLRVQNGENKLALIEEVSSTWLSIIKRILGIYKGYNLYIKLHPRQSNDELWHAIIQRLGDNIKIQVVDSQDSAETWILNSKVILADVSSVVWWCGFFKMKDTYSFDLFGYKAGTEIKEIPNIKYIDDLNKLSDYE